MGRSKITIARLMVIVLVVAIGIAALRESRSEVWASAMFTVTVIVLTTATLGSIVHHKASWVGFALFGWTCLFLAFGPVRQSGATPIPKPLTTMCLDWMSSRLNGDPIMPAGSSSIYFQEQTDRVAIIGGRSVSVPYTFLQTGNCLFSLVMAGVGSIIACKLAARHNER